MNQERYGLDRWGGHYFEILPNGDIGAKDPYNPETPALSLPQIVHDLEQRGIQTPVILRIENYLRHRVELLNDAFSEAIKASEYQNVYRGVFPIKVNQQAHVISNIVKFGKSYGMGLEAGSKAELLVALSQDLSKNSLIICNGVKDEEFIELATMSRRVGYDTVIVIESPKEVETVIDVFNRTGLEPRLGVRIKLTHRIGGKWEESSGDRSTFGLNTEQLMRIVDRLREAGLLHCLQLQHSHLGSQIPDIIDVRHAVTEACRYYCELQKEGVPLTHLDLGGGLGVDYTGERTATENSINYSVDEYAANVVETVKYALDEESVEHPVLTTESGRALVAMSSLLIMNVLEETRYNANTRPDISDDAHHLLKDLAAVEAYIEPRRLQECINDAHYYRDEMRALFRRGMIGIRDMAMGEHLYLFLNAEIHKVAMEAENEDAIEASRSVDIYHCNFSLFQSLPDVWAIDQLHPIAPLQRLDEIPGRHAILADITCDSDGKIDNFIVDEGESNALPVHEIGDEPYYLCVFFIGAYQETLGDLHNLFGDSNVASIRLEDGGFRLTHELEGDTIAEVMSYVEFDPKDCLENFKKVVDQAVDDGLIGGKERRQYTTLYRDSLNGYTYFE